MLNHRFSKIPLEFICPITEQVMKEPVIACANGHSYEREALEEYFLSNAFSIKNQQLIPNTILSILIYEQNLTDQRALEICEPHITQNMLETLTERADVDRDEENTSGASKDSQAFCEEFSANLPSKNMRLPPNYALESFIKFLLLRRKAAAQKLASYVIPVLLRENYLSEEKNAEPGQIIIKNSEKIQRSSWWENEEVLWKMASKSDALSISFLPKWLKIEDYKKSDNEINRELSNALSENSINVSKIRKYLALGAKTPLNTLGFAIRKINFHLIYLVIYNGEYVFHFSDFEHLLSRAGLWRNEALGVANFLISNLELEITDYDAFYPVVSRYGDADIMRWLIDKKNIAMQKLGSYINMAEEHRNISTLSVLLTFKTEMDFYHFEKYLKLAMQYNGFDLLNTLLSRFSFSRTQDELKIIHSRLDINFSRYSRPFFSALINAPITTISLEFILILMLKNIQDDIHEISRGVEKALEARPQEINRVLSAELLEIIFKHNQGAQVLNIMLERNMSVPEDIYRLIIQFSSIKFLEYKNVLNDKIIEIKWENIICCLFNGLTWYMLLCVLPLMISLIYVLSKQPIQEGYVAMIVVLLVVTMVFTLPIAVPSYINERAKILLVCQPVHEKFNLLKAGMVAIIHSLSERNYLPLKADLDSINRASFPKEILTALDRAIPQVVNTTPRRWAFWDSSRVLPEMRDIQINRVSAYNV